LDNGFKELASLSGSLGIMYHLDSFKDGTGKIDKQIL